MGCNLRFGARLWLCLVALAVSSAAFGKINGGFSAGDSNSLIYVRLTQTGSELTGYIQTLQANDSEPGYRSRTQQVSGQVDGKDFVLNSVIQGTVQSQKLSIEFPSTSGQSSRVVLTPISLPSWNASVSKFEQKHYARVQVRNLQLGFSDYCKALDSDESNTSEMLHRIEVEKSGDEMDKEFMAKGKRTLAQIDSAKVLLNAQATQPAINRLSKGQIEIASVANSAKLYYYPSKDALAQSVGSGWVCPSLRINSSWTMIFFSGRIYWLANSNIAKRVELVYSP